MEGFLESFLYLLITIVILVLSMRKRKTTETVTEEDNHRDNDPFSEVFGDESQEEYEPEPRPVTASRKAIPGQGNDDPWMTEAEAKKLSMDAGKMMQEAADDNPIARHEVVTEDDIYGIGHSGEDDGITFDLKKAVIYSEILNRREF